MEILTALRLSGQSNIQSAFIGKLKLNTGKTLARAMELSRFPVEGVTPPQLTFHTLCTFFRNIPK